MAFTVTVTGFNGAGTGSHLKVVVLTGATEAGGAQNAFSQSVAAAANWSLTPAGTNSLPLFVIYDMTGGSSGQYTASASNTLLDNSIQHDAFCDGYYSGTVTAATPVTLGTSAPAATKQQWASYEVLASGGVTPVRDGSTPPVAISATNTVTTASFTPPAGSVLVAMSSGNNSTVDGTISDTSGLGLAWTLRSHATNGAGGSTDLWTATVPAAVAAVPPPRPAAIPPGRQSPMAWQSIAPAPDLTPLPPPAAPTPVPFTDSGAGADSLTVVLPSGVVQSKQGSGTGTSLTITLDNPTGSGHGLVVFATAAGSTSNPSVSAMTLGGSADHFAVAATAGGSTDGSIVTCWLDLNCAAGQTSVVITSAGGSGTLGLLATVYERDDLLLASAFDKSSPGVNAGSGSWSSGATATTTQATEAWMGSAATVTASTMTGPSSPWVNLAQFSQVISGFTVSCMAGSQTVAATGAATYAGTVTGTPEWVALVVTLKLAAAAPSVIPDVAMAPMTGA